ncbi:MAG: nucleoside recognition protein [Clostridiales bacterium]|nr:nucleoside recognition protein [Clostridiales bacterium]
MLTWFWETCLGCGKSLWSMAIIVVPLMVGVEFLRHYQIMEKIGPVFASPLKKIGLPQEAVYPLFTGLFVGLLYGAGLIIESANQGELTKKHLFLLTLFLVVCHSVIEDYALFWALGANIIPIFILRFIVVILVVFGANKLLKEK